MNKLYNTPEYQEFLNAIPKPITRASIQNTSLQSLLQEATIQNAVKEITHCILCGIYDNGNGWQNYARQGCKKLEKKMVIPNTCILNSLYCKDPFSSYPFLHFKDGIPEVIERLKRVFTDFDFRQDEIGSYWIVDWS